MLNLHVKIDMHDTLAKLDQILRNIENSTSVVETTADEMVDYMAIVAQEYCPVRTGQLQESIRVEGGFPSYSIVADATDKYGVEYGPFVEFGTSLQEAQPFLWPAINEGLAVYIPIIRANFRAVIKGGP